MTSEPDAKALLAENIALKESIAALTSKKGKTAMEKEIAEAQRAALLARLPPSDTKALEGSVTIDTGATSEIQRLVHEGVAVAAKKMAQEILRKLPELRTLLIYNKKDIESATYYTIVKRQLDLLRDGYLTDMAEPARAANEEAAMMLPLLLPAVAGATLKSMVDLVSLFKRNVDIKGATVTFEEASLVAQVAKSVHEVVNTVRPLPANGNGDISKNEPQSNSSCGVDVIYSALFMATTLGVPKAEASPFLGTLADVLAMRQKAEMEISIFEPKSAADKTVVERHRIAELKALNLSCERLITAINKIGDEENLSALTVLLRGETLAGKMQGRNGAILFVKAVGGGENRTVQSLWSSGKLYHSGTALLTYLLFTFEDGLILSDVISKKMESRQRF